MKKALILLSTLLASSVAWGRTVQSQAMLNVRTADGTVSNYPYQLKVPNSSLVDNADGTMTFSAIISTNVLITGTTIYVASGTAVNFNATTIKVSTITSVNAVSFNLVGTNTNNSAPLGDFGEYISSVTAARPIGGTGAYADMAAIALTAGDWDVTGCGVFAANGATVTEVDLGISTTSGNSSTGLVIGDSTLTAFGIPTASVNSAVCVSNVRLSLSGSATAYLKDFATFSVATPTIAARISARRVR